jgi:predicted peptidase
MTSSRFSRRPLLVALCSLVVLGAAACGSSDGDRPDRQSPTTSASTTQPEERKSAPMSADTKELASQVRSEFRQEIYKDTETGTSLPYNIFLPEGYDTSKEYPMVLFIGDASLVGKDVTAPLSQYGALVWAGDRDQKEHQSIVLVPEFPEVIIDDRGTYTTTKHVEMTVRFVEAIQDTYAVDLTRTYGTGQSMGAMTVMYLAATHPNLFAAELFVAGQWDKTQLKGLADQSFFSIAAAGDSKAARGQKEVEKILKDAGAPYGTATFDATWSPRRLDAEARKLLGDGDPANFATFTKGTVLAGTPEEGVSEHAASFEPGYKIPAVRDWLFEQAVG